MEEGTTMTTTTVNNGTTSKQVDTTGMNIATYNVQLEYDGNSTYNSQTTQSTLNIKDGSIHKIGLNTDTPWAPPIIPQKYVALEKAWVNYRNTPLILSSLPFSGDFRVTIELGVDYMGAYGNFGFTTSNNSLNPEIRVYNTTINNNTNINTVFTEKNKVETVTFTRIGNTYTYTQNGTSYTATVSNPTTVYFYVQKNGNGSIFLDTIEYQNL